MNNFETNRTLLRHVISSDFDSLKVMLMDVDVMSMTGFKEPQSEESSRELLEKWLTDDYVCVAINKETNHLVGWFMLKETISKKYPEIGFMISKQYWSQGYATEVSMSLVNLAKSEFGVLKIIASAHVNNIASLKVLKKIGMKVSDTLPSKDNIIYYEIECS